MTEGIRNDTVYIELQGSDGNSSRQDIAVVNVTSNASSPMGFQLRLRETGVNTGIYRGNFTISNRTNEDHRLINARPGEVITISSVQDPTKNATITVLPFMLYPLVDNATAIEDMLYSEHYWTVNRSDIQWGFATNADWLGWDPAGHNMSGTPNNTDIGSFWACLNISDDQGNYDVHNFTISVQNTPPKITTANVTSGYQDQYYWVDYNSSDDGQGAMTWHLSTNSSWLKMNSTTGELNGTPLNKDVGDWRVNVSVDDGHNGWDWANFTLTVNDMNDRPNITTADKNTTLEDQPYNVTYTATDIDKGDSITWTYSSNASWLSLDATVGRLSGTPTNDDVGRFWVNVTATDNGGLSDFHNFTLEVINVNDLPVITSTPGLEAKVGIEYAYNVTAYDVDKGDILAFGFDMRSEGMVIDASNGSVRWTPTSDQVGANKVVLKVSDGNASVPQTFEINVTEEILPLNHAPNITSSSPLKAAVGIKYTYQVVAVDEDIGDVLHYSLDKAPDGMTIDPSSGLVEWTPTLQQVGEQQAIVNVSDGRAWVLQEFKVLVKSDSVVNHKPTLDPISDQTVEIDQPFSYQAVGKDVDTEDTLAFTLVEKPANMTTSASGAISWTPTADQVGTHKVTVKVFDGTDEATASFTITVKEKEGGKTGMGGSDLLTPLLILLVIIIVAVAVAALVMRKKGKGMKEPPEGERAVNEVETP